MPLAVETFLNAIKPGAGPLGGSGATLPRSPLGKIDSTPNANVTTQVQAVVEIETLPGSNEYARVDGVEWASIDCPMDGQDFAATLTVTLDIEKITDIDPTKHEHFAHFLDKLKPDVRVRIVQGRSRGASIIVDKFLFVGFPKTHSIHWSGENQSMQVQCLSEGQELLRTGIEHQIQGRFMRSDTAKTFAPDEMDAFRLVMGLPAVFNPGGKPNRAPEAVPRKVNEGSDTSIHAWTFDDDHLARPWSYAQAMRAVAWFWIHNTSAPPVSVVKFLRDTVEIGNTPPSPNSNDPLIAKLTALIEDVSIQSMNADEALVVLNQAAGTHYLWPIDRVDLKTTPGTQNRRNGDPQQYLRVLAVLSQPTDIAPMRQMREPVVHATIPRDAPFTNYINPPVKFREKVERNKARTSAVIIDHNIINAPIYLAGYVEYEVTLLLRPGWVPHPMLDPIGGRLDFGNQAPTAFDADARVAFNFWAFEFDDRFRGNRLQRSVYDSEHPAHNFPTTTLDMASQIPIDSSGTPSGTDTIPVPKPSDVFRLWVFPDDPQLVDKTANRSSDPTGGTDTGLAREAGPWRAATDGSSLYDIWITLPDDNRVLAYHDPVTGGDIHRSELSRWLPMRRAFLDTIGRLNASTTSRAPIVRLHFGHDGANADTLSSAIPAPDALGWTPIFSNYEVLEDRAAIRLNLPNIFNDPLLRDDMAAPLGKSNPRRGLAMMNYIQNAFWVSITCTVRADERMFLELNHSADPVPSVKRVRSTIIDLGYDRFKVRLRRKSATNNVAGNSFLQWSGTGANVESALDEPEYEDRDDGQALQDFVDAQKSLIVPDRVNGDLTIPFLDASFVPGDSFAGMIGLGIPFNANTEIERVRWTNNLQAGQQTTLVLADLRSTPEL